MVWFEKNWLLISLLKLDCKYWLDNLTYFNFKLWLLTHMKVTDIDNRTRRTYTTASHIQFPTSDSLTTIWCQQSASHTLCFNRSHNCACLEQHLILILPVHGRLRTASFDVGRNFDDGMMFCLSIYRHWMTTFKRQTSHYVLGNQILWQLGKKETIKLLCVCVCVCTDSWRRSLLNHW